jgi:hypothetical protein
MLALYLFLLVLGAGMAALSLFGDLLDVGGGDADALTEVGGDAAADGSGGWWKIFSLIGLVYGAMGAGGTGTLLHLLWDGGRPGLTLILAGGSGFVCGALASSLLSYLKRSGSGDAPEESSFEGLAAVVTLPIREGIPGRIKVQRGSREHVLRALPYPSAVAHRATDVGAAASDGTPSAEWRQVIVVEVRAGVAYVTPAGRELAP